MRVRREENLEPAVTLAPVYSRHNNFVNAGRTFSNNKKSYGSSVIGASLLPFLSLSPDDISCGRSNDSIDNAAMWDNGFAVSVDAGRCHKKGKCDRGGRDCLSLLLNGKAPTDTANSSDNGHNQRRQQQQSKTPSRKHILLRGPPRSGKSSLGMNLAYAKAASDNNCCGGLSCDCVAALVYRPNMRICNGHNWSNDDKDRFPLYCRALQSESYKIPPMNSNTQKANDRMVDGSEAVVMGNDNESVPAATDQKQDSWDPKILNKIRIRRVSSVRDLWEDLLVMAGKPVTEQPTRVIIVEDIDEIIGLTEDFSNDNNNRSSCWGNRKHNSLVGMMLKTCE
mmetsp:Transcript_8108/g.16805  ORF Transcript_8108/g.16805 Transcript_8108/m.16805 type:complete len:338 (-) Transcript_8108:1039-2052(-)